MTFDMSQVFHFEHNLGENSKKNRYLLASAILIVAVFTGSWLLLLSSLLVAATAYSGWCPVFSGLGKNTATSDSKLFFDINRMVKFEQNLGKKSQNIRYIVGGVLFLLSFMTSYIIVFPLSLAILALAYLKWDPIFSGLGKNTFSTSE